MDPTGHEPHRRLSFPRRSFLILAATLTAVGVAWLVHVQWATESTSSEERVGRAAAEAPREAPSHGTDVAPVDVQVTQSLRRDLAYTITLPANIAPLYQTTLYAKVSGYLKWIGPDKGDTVKKGELLAVIDAPEIEEQYQQAVADYRIKKLTYERLIKVWKESPDVIAKQDVDVAEAAYQGARHSMEQREALRAYTKVRAPYDGTITARFADPRSVDPGGHRLGDRRDSTFHDNGFERGPDLCQCAAG